MRHAGSPALGLQRGYGRGASLSKPSIRVAWSHSPHHGGRGGRWPGGGGSSAAESRTASTAYGFRTPPAFAPANLASSCGVQPAFSAASTAGVSLDRWAAVSGQAGPSARKNFPAPRRRRRRPRLLRAAPGAFCLVAARRTRSLGNWCSSTATAAGEEEI